MRTSRRFALALSACFVFGAMLLVSSLQAAQFRRGDVNGSGTINNTDAFVILGHLFRSQPARLDCADAADVDDDGLVTLSDAVALLDALYSGTAIPPPLFECGPDPTPDSLGCAKYPECPAVSLSFSDGFEGILSVKELFPADFSRWHGLQLEPTLNRVELAHDVVHDGLMALRFCASGSIAVSKADVSRDTFDFRRGDDVWFSAWYLIFGTNDHQYLWDIEDPSLYSYGRRLYIMDGGRLACDGKWSPTPVVFRSQVLVPRNRWVRIKVHMFLHESSGRLEVWQDGAKVIDGTGPTLPSATAVYSRMQVGITANAARMDQVLYLDDVVVDEVDIP